MYFSRVSSASSIFVFVTCIPILDLLQENNKNALKAEDAKARASCLDVAGVIVTNDEKVISLTTILKKNTSVLDLLLFREYDCPVMIVRRHCS